MVILLKKAVSLMVVTMMAVGLSSCSSKPDLSKDRLEAVKSAKVLRLGTEATYPPMEFTDDSGKLVGFDIDMVTEIAKRMGLKIEVISTDFAGITEGLAANRFDVIAATMNITPKREESVLFSKPYIDKVGLSIVVKKGDTKVTGFGDLADKIVAVQQGSTGDEYAALKGYKNVKKYIKISDGLLDLKAGRVDAVVTDNVVGAYYMLADKESYQMLDAIEEALPVGIAIPKNSPLLKAEVDKYLDEMVKDGTMSQLSQKWFGKDIFK